MSRRQGPPRAPHSDEPFEIATRRKLSAFIRREFSGPTAVRGIEPAPSETDPLPRPSKTVLRSGSFELATTRLTDAGASVVWRRFRFVGQHVTRWSMAAADPDVGDPHLSSFVLRSQPGPALVMDVGDFRSAAEVWHVTTLPAEIRPMPAMPQRGLVDYVVPARTLPSPAEFVRLLGLEDLPVAWVARDDGTIVAPFVVPRDLEGHDLYIFPPRQMRRPDHARIRVWESGDDVLVVHLDAADTSPGRELERLLCRLPGVTVATGNCRFTGPQWLDGLHRTRVEVHRPDPTGAAPAKVLPFRR